MRSSEQNKHSFKVGAYNASSQTCPDAEKRKNEPKGLCGNGPISIILENRNDPGVNGAKNIYFYLPNPSEKGCSRFQWTKDGSKLIPKNKNSQEECDELDLAGIPPSFPDLKCGASQVIPPSKNASFGNESAEPPKFFNETWTPSQVYGGDQDRWDKGEYRVRGVYKICTNGECYVNGLEAEFSIR